MYCALLTIVDTELNQASRPDHLRYIGELFRQGKVFMAGPFADGSGGMVLYQNVNENEATALASGDPAVTSGARTVDVRRWNPLDLPSL